MWYFDNIFVYILVIAHSLQQIMFNFILVFSIFYLFSFTSLIFSHFPVDWINMSEFQCTIPFFWLLLLLLLFLFTILYYIAICMNGGKWYSSTFSLRCLCQKCGSSSLKPIRSSNKSPLKRLAKIFESIETAKGH